MGTYKATYKQPRDYSKIGLVAVVITAVALLVFNTSFNKWYAENTVSFTKPVEAEIIPVIPVSELEDRLDAIVWGGESGNHRMVSGDTLMTFDPPRGRTAEERAVWWSRCTKVGGEVNLECYSFGPRQIKLPTLIGYWKQLHGETLTEKAARDIAEDNEKSRRFFLDCAIRISGCALKWTTATDANGNSKPEVQVYIDLIRKAERIQLGEITN